MGDIEVVRLNGALLNVLQTNATDVNVTLRGRGGQPFKKNIDYVVVPPDTNGPLDLSNPDFLAMAAAGNLSTKVRARMRAHNRRAKRA